MQTSTRDAHASLQTPIKENKGKLWVCRISTFKTYTHLG